MADDYFMKQPCKHCPFRRDVKPFLRPSRGEELAIHAANPYNTFPCHKTTVSDEEYGGDGTHNVANESSKECAGFMTLQINEGAPIPEGFKPAYELVYSTYDDMIDAYADQ